MNTHEDIRLETLLGARATPEKATTIQVTGQSKS
jgi:hypothetical protein